MKYYVKGQGDCRVIPEKTDALNYAMKRLFYRLLFRIVKNPDVTQKLSKQTLRYREQNYPILPSTSLSKKKIEKALKRGTGMSIAKEKWRENGSSNVGTPDILGSEFRHSDESFYSSCNMDEGSDLWDEPGQNFQPGMPSNSNQPVRNLIYQNGSVLPQTFRRPGIAPPLPPRPQNIASTYNPPGSYCNNYNIGSYPSYGVSNFGYGYRPGFNTFNYGYGQNGYFGANNPETRFIQLAEESSRPAFQAIHSVLQSFSSVAMMFDSTFNALYSSYMSVLSVADNFGKLRSSFGQVFSLLAMFRGLYYIYRRLLYYLGISQINPETEHLWVNALKGTNDTTLERTQKPWSTMLLLSIIMAGPYLLFKLMTRLYPNPVKEAWNPTLHPGTTAVGVYDFHSTNNNELSFSTNQKLMIAPETFQPANCPGWLLACDRNKKTGLIPKNYVGLMMRSEKTGKPYMEHNGQHYDISKFVELGRGRNFGESPKTYSELHPEKDKKTEDDVSE